jgi:hypothetical protein
MSDELKLPTPEEVEKIMIEKELASQKALNTNAEFFYLYIHRFNEQLKFMSKKDTLRLIGSLIGSPYNKSDDTSKALAIGNRLNLSSIKRTLINVLEQYMEKDVKDVKQFSSQETTFFKLLDELFANKYVTSILAIKPDQEIKIIDDVIKTTHDVKEFNKRKTVEKDAFATANQLLYTKMALIQHTLIQYLENEEKKNGTEKET